MYTRPCLNLYGQVSGEIQGHYVSVKSRSEPSVQDSSDTTSAAILEICRLPEKIVGTLWFRKLWFQNAAFSETWNSSGFIAERGGGLGAEQLRCEWWSYLLHCCSYHNLQPVATLNTV